MSEVQLDGFRFSKWHKGRLLLIVESSRLQACVNYCNEHQVPWLHISPYHGYHLEDLNFLRDCPQVIGLHLQRGFYDMDGLYSMPRLESLSVIFQHDIDFSALSALRDLSTEWNPRIDEGLRAARSLTQLWLLGYKPAPRDLTDLATLSQLQELGVSQARIDSLRGVEALRHLRRLEVDYCRSLTDIGPLASLAAGLEELELDHCRKIEDLTFVRVLKNLRKLILADCGSVPSLAFVAEMPKLEFLSFVGTTVLDGDMRPCFNLKYAGFMNKRRYSHTSEEVREIIRQRIGGSSLHST